MLQPVTAQVMDAAPRLRLIQKIGVGVNTIDLATARAKHVRVANKPGTNSQAVAEHALMLMLAVIPKVRELDEAVRSGHGRNMDPAFFDGIGELSGRTVGFLGFGEIPRRLEPALTALGAKVIYCMSEREPSSTAQKRSFESLLATADILSLHVPLTDETHEIINRHTLSLMRPGAILINTARGGLVNQKDLMGALTSGCLAGAGLDVMPAEPCSPNDPLATLGNVVLTPHGAWLTQATLRRSFSVIVENCRRLRDEEELNLQIVP